MGSRGTITASSIIAPAYSRRHHNAAFTGAIAVLGPIVADATFGRASWGLVLASETVGFVLGGLIALHWRPRHALGIGVALTGMTAVPVMLLAVVPQVPVLIATFFLGGMAVEQFGIAWDQSLQQNISADRLSRVYSYDAAISFIAIPVGQICVGPLAGNFGTTPTPGTHTLVPSHSAPHHLGTPDDHRTPSNGAPGTG